MTDNEIRVAIALTQGFRFVQNRASRTVFLSPPESVDYYSRDSGLDIFSTLPVCVELGDVLIQSQHGESILPHYTTSHDALAPVLAGLSDVEWKKYDGHLRSLSEILTDREHHSATPRQKCEALLKAGVITSE